jgi:50S ribosomal protein L16 3-hydroxylase
MTLPIEITARRTLPLGLPPARFLRDYWQKRPLLIRGAFPKFRDPLTPNDLAGLACEEMALSRLVVHEPRADRWALRNGPFAETDFARLPKCDWTVLVQDVDKWDADVAALLAHFAFLPAWRIDDVMVSYAVDRGSVGAHVDHYDVFLLQGLGQRRWRISTDPSAPKGFRTDAELKLLREFRPTHEWVLESGDMLYLPPGVPHHGVAVGECLTYSIGMRAPSRSDLLVDFAESLAETMPDEIRLGDGDLTPARGDGEIDEAAMRRVAVAMPWLSVGGDSVKAKEKRREKTVGGTDGCSGDVDASMLRTWFGRFITRYRSAHTAAPRARTLSDSTFARAFDAHARAVRNPWSRAAWVRSGDGAQLFVAGEDFACSRAFARRICAATPVALDAVKSARDRNALRALVDAGHLTLVQPPRRRRR